MTRLPGDFASSRATLHVIAAHVLGRRRFEVSGHFGLRASPGGFGTPAFGEGPETVRVAGAVLVHETGADAASVPIAGSTLRELAAFAGADVDRDFSVGAGMPAPGDLDAPLNVGADSGRVVADWFAIGWRVLDDVLGGLAPGARPATVQLWPEHFDAGTNVGLASGSRVNLGASPGDAFSAEPYLYVSPWGSERPGERGFWNAPFGAVLVWRDVVGETDPVDAGTRFMRTGLARLNP